MRTIPAVVVLLIVACDDGGQVSSLPPDAADAHRETPADGSVLGDVRREDGPVDAATARGPDADTLACVAGGCDDDGHCGPDGECASGPCEGDDTCVAGAWCNARGTCEVGCRVGARGACPEDMFCDHTHACAPADECLDAERCINGIDDDCDGLVDDDCGDCDPERPCDTGRAGKCGAGVQTCGDAPGCEVPEPSDERCNGEDDDCDGSTDEDWPDLRRPCDDGVGQCEGAGRWRCADDESGLVCAGFENAAGDEACNGRDDDCDGRTDEDFAGFGEPCRVGRGVCAATGRGECAGNGSDVECDAAPGEGTDEVCDGLDNDCDGPVDEDFAGVGGPCVVGDGRCESEGRLVCDADGGTRCDAEARVPEPETCNGVDDDCDGSTDEGLAPRPCYNGTPDSEGVGPCRGGGESCVRGEWTACEGEVVPQPERCDGADNDCNGVVDDDRGFALRVDCYGGPPGTADVGACRSGARRCEGGVLGPCEGEVGPSLEICDVTDNDCNGAVDDIPDGCDCEPGEARPCYGGPDGTDGTGACHGGVQTCRPERIWSVCVGQVVPSAEVCDGADNDCDGAPDDGVEGVGAACVAGVGACAREGVTACGEGGLGCGVAPGDPAPERCNGLDDDCDGATDEVFAAGVACEAGLGACLRQGVTACTDNGELSCTAVPGAPSDEACNEVDDDCDGFADEGLAVGEPCVAGRGVCARDGVRRCGADADVFCDGSPGDPGGEVCDGLDNDCDGRTDEGFGIGEACTVGVGACESPGLRACDPDGGTRCDAIEGRPSPEACNDVDDDCDGDTDEDLVGLGNCVADAPGACAAGRFECVGGDLECAVAIEPGEEACNGQDDDCDGFADERLGVVACGRGECRRNVAVCLDGRPGPCNPLLGAFDFELCDGRDNDCDGESDEDARGDGDPCSNGNGGCARQGVRRCVDAALVCDAVPGEASDERCNGIDDDCDNALDEDPGDVGGVCFVGVGACREEGPVQCADGELECLAAPGFADDEECNGVDDDCDGTTDEGFGDAVCGTGACRHFLAACDGGEPPECDPRLGARAEACNGVDDDCDGGVDEEAAGTGDPCSEGVGACRAQGVTVCRGALLVCGAQPAAAQPERCDAFDNDCDGDVDEDAVDAGGECEAGEGLCRRQGRLECDDGLLACSARAGRGGNERCNGLDDDCDGTTDEGIGTRRCGVGACDHAVPTCADGQPNACDPLEGARPERCNGADEDCDGEVDEDAAGAGGACSVGVGACRGAGVQRCVNSALQCDAERVGQPSVEVCNRVDDDCDGRTDEGTGQGQQCVAGVGLCQRVGQTRCGGDGALVCDAVAGDPAEEVCNRTDDDCDGRSDEGLGDFGACDTGAPGVCGPGARRCVRGEVACVASVRSTAEVCDGLDNDCDGQTDEDLGTRACGVGVCARDIAACEGGAPTPCDPFVGAIRETCNAADDDCDGDTDEDSAGVGEPCANGVGACARVGARRCAAIGELACDAEPGDPVPELCNALDDDCDGDTDEETLDTGIACAAGVGECADERTLECDDGRVVCPAVAGAPAAEVCNALDDDCDGELDEGFGSVVCGVGRCRHAVQNCAGGAPPECDPQEGARAESCNGIDDDCDGATDEDVPDLGQDCVSGAGECRREGVRACLEGVVRCNVDAGEPGIELCDGRDNDCDAFTDEDAVDVGQVCVSDVGACARDGHEVCRRGALVCDAAPGQPAIREDCNGVDDDCDGATDERTGSITCGNGVCRRDLPACVNGAPAQCDPFVGAGQELCNGADDDCDGQLDEDTGVLECGEGVCAQAIPRCVGGVVNECDPLLGAGPEVCNGRDDDCDGAVDEDPRGVGDGCANGVGRCRRDGLQRCDDGALRCDAVPGAPDADELCNSVDDDCDGTVDEDPTDTGELCFRGLGGCERGAPTECIDGASVCPAVPGEPEPDDCNNIDDDCDGLVDEPGVDCNRNGFDDACDLLFGRSPDCNGNDRPDECEGGGCQPDRTPPEVTLEVDPRVLAAGGLVRITVSAEDDRLVAEILAYVDGEDVELDALGQAFYRFDDPGLHTVGAIARDGAGNQHEVQVEVRVTDPDDDAAPELAISAPRPGERLEGLSVVQGTVSDPNLTFWQLSYGPPQQPDAVVVAEGDFQVVDGVMGAIDPAQTGLGDFAVRLYAEDINGNARTLTQPFSVGSCQPAPERCDGVDNDCDGDADEGFGPVGQACFVGLGECQGEGVVRCFADGLGSGCDARPGDRSPERCDDRDHDCDGADTNGFDVGGACRVGVGACARDGVRACNAGGAGTDCVGDPGAPQEEVCNGVDDDCDGEVDDGFRTITCGLGACEHTISECDDGEPGGELECDPLEGAGEEVCGPADDDCDGVVDEHARDELCNGEDDDCDGLADEADACPDEEPPTVTVNLSLNIVNVGARVTLFVRANDNRAVTSLVATVDGEAVPLDQFGDGLFVPDAPGFYEVVAVARDAAGNEATDEKVLRVLDPGDVQAPFIEVTAPESSEGVVDEPTDIVGTITDANLVEYRVLVSRVDQGRYQLIATGDEEVRDGTIAVLDPTTLESGIYDVRVEAEDVNGRLSAHVIIVRVEGDAKIGHYTMTFVDANVVVAGVELTVRRTYDSRKRVVGDFGVGWHLDIRRGRLEHNRPIDQDWIVQPGRFTPCGVGQELATHLAEIRLSDRETYLFRPVLNRPAALLGACQVRVDYQLVSSSLPGNPTLQILGDPFAIVLNGTTELRVFGNDLFEVNQVRLTTADGRVLDLDADDGTFRLADPKGNEVTIARDGLTHDSGKTMRFERDAQGRITALVDPGGARVGYTYDGAGDLAATTDRVGNDTTYAYDRRHYLLEVRDPLGNVPTRQEFDDEGRLVATVDAFGNRQSFAHDLGGRAETVTDKLGHVRVLQYDADGNVVREVGKRGQVVTRVFDGDGRKTSETDARGATTRFAYDGAGRLDTITNDVGGQRAQTYDARNNLLSDTDYAGNETTHTYDGANNRLTTTDARGQEVTRTFDNRGNKLTETDHEGNVRRWTYTPEGWVATDAQPARSLRRFTYDANGRKLTETRPWTNGAGDVEDLVWRYGYDANGRLTTVTDPLGGVTRTTYDQAGSKLTETDPLGRTTRLAYDAAGQLVRKTWPSGAFEEYEWDAEGRRTAVTGRDGDTTRTRYDADGNVVRIDYPDGSFVTRTYDARNQLVRETDALGNAKENEWDALGRLVLTRDALGDETRFEHDAAGNLVTTTPPDGEPTRREYDAARNVTRIVYADDRDERFEYDSRDNKTLWVDVNGHPTRYAYDGANQLVRVTDAAGGETVHAYDELGNRVATTDANGHTTRFVYDALGRKLSTIRPGGESDVTEYDAAGQLARYVDFDGVVTTATWNADGEALTRSFPGDVERVTRQASGRRTRFADARGVETWAYDARGRVSEHTNAAGDVFAYTYDVNGDITSRETPAGEVRYAYDAAQRLATVTDPDGGVTRYTYNEAGSVASVSRANGAVTTYTYDVRQRLTELVTRDDQGALLAGYRYTLGPAGERLRVVELHRPRLVDYTYDALYRLVEERIEDDGAARTIAYAYDAVGNRSRRSDSVDGDVVYAYDDNDQLVQAGGARFDYNARGDLVSIQAGGGEVDYTYDPRGRLVSVDDGATELGYTYDANGNRVTRTVDDDVTRYAFDTNYPFAQVVRTTDGDDNELATYVYGHDLLSQHAAGVAHYFAYDGQLSTRQLLDAGGAVATTFDYDAFGGELARAGEVDTPFRYGGEYTDANSGFVYLRARWYDPQSGRFMRTDPDPGRLFEPATLHRYTYALNDPVLRGDPSGEFSLVSISISISIGGSLRSIYTKNLVKTFLEVFRIANCQLRVGADVRKAGFELLASGVFAGAGLVGIGQELMGAAFKAIAATIANFYQNVFNDLTTVKIGVAAEIAGFGTFGASGGVNGSGTGSGGVSWSAAGTAWSDYADKLGTVLGAGAAAFEGGGNPCAAATFIETSGKVLADILL